MNERAAVAWYGSLLHMISLDDPKLIYSLRLSHYAQFRQKIGFIKNVINFVIMLLQTFI